MKKLYISPIVAALIPHVVCAQAKTQNPNTAPGGSGLYWKTTGNNNTVDGTHFIGTTYNVPFNIRVNNLATGRLDTRGNIYLGQGAGNTSAIPYSNIGIGRGTLHNATNRSNLVAIGDRALYNNGTGATFSAEAVANTAPESKCLLNNTTGGCQYGCRLLFFAEQYFRQL